MFKTRVVVLFVLSSADLPRDSKGCSKRKPIFRNSFEIYKTHSCFPWAGNRGAQYPRPTFDYSRVLPSLIVRPCRTLGSAVAHDSGSFWGVVHSRRTYTYIQQWWYSSRVCVCVFSRHSFWTSTTCTLVSQHCWQYVQAMQQ